MPWRFARTRYEGQVCDGDLMEVAGKSMSSADRIEIGDETLMETSALLRNLLKQIDEQVEVMKEG